MKGKDYTNKSEFERDLKKSIGEDDYHEYGFLILKHARIRENPVRVYNEIFKAALSEVMALARASNGYLDVKQPWKQRKSDPEGCATTLNVCAQTVKALATLMAPFLPHAAGRCREMLRLPQDGLDWSQATAELPDGHTLGEPEILFRKLDPEPEGEA